MRKTAFLIVLLIGIGLTAATVDDAVQKAQQYQNSGETPNIRPQGLTYAGTSSYWVIELVGTYSRIEAMVPVNSKTGNVEVSDSMKEVLKTHYLANYFATDDTIPDFLDSMLTYAENKWNQFNDAQNKLGLFEAQIPPDNTVTELQPLKGAVQNSMAKNDDFRDQIQDAKSIVTKTAWRTTDVALAKASLSDVFTKEQAFLNSLGDTSNHANDFLTELASDPDMMANHTQLVGAFQTAVSPALTETVSAQMSDNLNANKNTVNAFFGGLDAKGTEYLAKLKDRFNSKISQGDIAAIETALNGYQANYTYIVDNADSLPPAYSDNIQGLYSLITEAQGYFNAGNYTKTEEQFGSIDDAIALLMGHMGECPPECTGGKIAGSDCLCACPEGTKESGDQCVGTGYSLNLPFIGGLVLVMIVLIVFKYRDKIFPRGGEIEEKPKDAWTNYKF